MQENVLTGGHGLMVEGYYPVLQALAKDIDIRLNHRFVPKLYYVIHMFSITLLQSYLAKIVNPFRQLFMSKLCY